MTAPDTPRPRDSRSPRPAASESQTAPLDNGTESPVSRRAFLGQAGKLAAGTAGLSLTPALLAACGSTTTHVDSSTTATGQEGDWRVDGARTLPEVIVIAPSSGGGTVSVYDTEFRSRLTGRLIDDANVLLAAPVPTPTLSFLYEVREGGTARADRSVLHLMDLESGTDEIVFSGSAGRYVGSIVRMPGSDEVIFAYGVPSGEGGPPPGEIWRAARGEGERIRFEESYRAAADESEAAAVAYRGIHPLADIRPLATDGRQLFFARDRLYSLDLSTRDVTRLGTCEAPVAAWLSPDGSRLAARGQYLERDTAPLRVVVIDLGSGAEADIVLPEPVEEASGGAWHPDGKVFACVGDSRLLGDGPSDAPVWVGGQYAYSAVYLVDVDTGAAIEVARAPAAHAEPLTTDNYSIDSYLGHGVLGFTRDGGTLLIIEGQLMTVPRSSSTTPNLSGVEGEVGLGGTPSRIMKRIAAIDIATDRRVGLSPAFSGSAQLLHR
ncbi:MAG: hypothetical protein M5T61_14330 [Acidimicrobiia bacterium]|nr:hypothetical protein [Acidimicrobiia bacterium]